MGEHWYLDGPTSNTAIQSLQYSNRPTVCVVIENNETCVESCQSTRKFSTIEYQVEISSCGPKIDALYKSLIFYRLDYSAKSGWRLPVK